MTKILTDIVVYGILAIVVLGGIGYAIMYVLAKAMAD